MALRDKDGMVAALKAAADPTRLRLLALLAAGALNVKDLTRILGQSQPRISRHLKLLTEAGLIARAQEIDLRDGVADGRHTSEHQRLICSNCRRQLSRRAKRCFYCGCRELERD